MSHPIFFVKPMTGFGTPQDRQLRAPRRLGPFTGETNVHTCQIPAAANSWLVRSIDAGDGIAEIGRHLL
jgi:hypothetical protein